MDDEAELLRARLLHTGEPERMFVSVFNSVSFFCAWTGAGARPFLIWGQKPLPKVSPSVDFPSGAGDELRGAQLPTHQRQAETGSQISGISAETT